MQGNQCVRYSLKEQMMVLVELKVEPGGVPKTEIVPKLAVVPGAANIHTKTRGNFDEFPRHTLAPELIQEGVQLSSASVCCLL
jgi:hypothetical protein